MPGLALDLLLAPPRHPRRGFPSGWRRYQALLALALCRDDSPGRERLASELGITVGAARNLITMLQDRGSLTVSPRGVTLTPGGEEVLDRLGLVHAPIAAGDLTIGRSDHALRLAGHAGAVTSGMRQRDVALMAGASGATTLVSGDGHWRLPDGRRPDAELEGQLDRFPHTDGDVLTIGTALHPLEARRGAFAIGTDLLMRGSEDG